MQACKAICEHCYEYIDGEITFDGDNVVLTKTCPTHGQSSHVVEPQKWFYEMTREQESDVEKRNQWSKMFTTTGLDVTRRCNVKCPHCYVEPDNQVKDVDRSLLVSLAKQVKKAESIILMGAEPTMRNDLPELISEIKAETSKTVGIYTNAIKLADEEYAEKLKEAGLNYACVSLHTRDYLGNEKLFDKKVVGMKNLIDAGISIHHISFSLQTMADLDVVLADAIKLQDCCSHIRIRSPQKVGICNDEPLPLSDLLMTTIVMLEDAGHKVDILSSDNTLYHVNLLVDNKLVLRCIRWPTLETAIIDELDCPPYALFDPVSGEVNLVLSFLIQESKRNASIQTNS